MKRITIYKREVLERTGFRKYPYKDVTQYIIFYGGKKVLANCSESIENPRLKIKFNKFYESRSWIKLNLLRNSLAKKRDNASRELVSLLNELDKRTEIGEL